MKRNLIDLTSALVILLFLYTGISKIDDFHNFKFDITEALQFQWASATIGVLIIAAELGAALVLLLGLLSALPFLRPYDAILKKGETLSLRTSLLLMIVFTIYVACILILIPRGHRPCSCGGIMRQLTWWNHLWVNLGLTALLAVVNYLDWKGTRYSIQSIPAPLGI